MFQFTVNILQRETTPEFFDKQTLNTKYKHFQGSQCYTTTTPTTTSTTATTTSTTTTTTTTLGCPEIYLNDPASILLCQLWEELQKLIAESNNSGLIIGVSPQLILCQYRDHSTSAFLLCQLWCEIQTFFNKVKSLRRFKIKVLQLLI